MSDAPFRGQRGLLQKSCKMPCRLELNSAGLLRGAYAGAAGCLRHGPPPTPHERQRDAPPGPPTVWERDAPPGPPPVRRSSPHTSSITAFRQDQFRPRRARTCREPLAHQGGDPPRPGQVGALSRQRISPPSLTMSARVASSRHRDAILASSGGALVLQRRGTRRQLQPSF
jgi:hypothetical protein